MRSKGMGNRLGVQERSRSFYVASVLGSYDTMNL